MRSLALVVVEAGSALPRIFDRTHTEIAMWRAFGEAHKFERALCARVARLQRSPELAVLACNTETHDAAIRRRVTIARNLLCVLRPRTGHLVLSAARGADSALRSQLLGIAGTLSETLRSHSPCVSVRFDCLGAQGETDRILRAHVVKAMTTS
jgi:hypothetical protein